MPRLTGQHGYGRRDCLDSHRKCVRSKAPVMHCPVAANGQDLPLSPLASAAGNADIAGARLLPRPQTQSRHSGHARPAGRGVRFSQQMAPWMGLLKPALLILCRWWPCSGDRPPSPNWRHWLMHIWAGNFVPMKTATRCQGGSVSRRTTDVLQVAGWSGQRCCALDHCVIPALTTHPIRRHMSSRHP
jgi:hypothetical protein